MPIHGNAAVSHGNDWLQTLKQPIPWIWDGLVAEDAVTLLSAPEKTGKTTLLSLLLDRRREGGQALTRGCELGILVRTGAGNKAEAFRYGLAQPQPAA
jgi:hypothetical protein